MPLLPKDGTKETDEELLTFTSRFKSLKTIEMLSEILSGPDYYEYPEMLKIKHYSLNEWKNLCSKCNKEDNIKVLAGILDNTIDLESYIKGESTGAKEAFGSIIETYGVFEIIDFVNKAKKVCQQSLKKQFQMVEENLVGKVRGHILVRKQIKYNEAKGQIHKCYCSYNSFSEDIIENRIMKYALYLCQHSQLGEALSEDIHYCMNTLSSVPLKKCSGADFVGIKNNGAYRFYKDVMSAAKKIINRYYLSDNRIINREGDNDDVIKTTELKKQNTKISPYFINMNLLFELYCRAITRKAIDKFNSETKQENYKLSLESARYAERSLFEDENGIGCFMKHYIPDIVINKIESQSDGKPQEKCFAVLDAKNSNVFNSDKKRERTHQIMFYMKALNCNHGGLISPAEKKDKEKEIAKLKGQNNVFLSNIPVFVNGKCDSISEIFNYLKEIANKENNKTEEK